MTDDTLDACREQIESANSQRERLKDLLDAGEVPEENVPRTRRMVGSDARAIGTYRLRLGECERAADEFRLAADHYRTALETTRDREDSLVRGEPIRLRDLLEVALLSGDDSLIEAASDLALETPLESAETLPDKPYHYYYPLAVAATIAETGGQQEYLERLDDAIEEIDPAHTEGDLRGYYRTRSSALSGVVSRDGAQFDSGLSELLSHHEKASSSESTQPDQLVCIGGSALIVLARRKGMDVRVDSPFVPECVFEIA